MNAEIATRAALSKLVVKYPDSWRGSWRLRLLTSPFLVAEVDSGVWMRVSGLVNAEWRWLKGDLKEPGTAAFLQTYFKPGMNVVDVGANVGYFSMMAAARVREQGSVVSFEPTPEVAARLRENIALNNFHWVEAVEAAVTDKSGPVNLYAASGTDSEENSLSAMGETTAVYSVKGVTIDDYFAARPPGRIDLIKIDAEGAEPTVLRGAAGMIRRDYPDLLMEVNPLLLKAAESSPDEVLDILSGFGYA
jgi:FkbM family methyltransferase